MAQYVHQYVSALLPAQVTAARMIGTDIYKIQREMYVVNLSLLALIGVIAKALNDKGIVLDAEWQTRLNAAIDGTWPADILGQVDPDEPPAVV